MTLVRRLARPLLAAQFVWGGIDQLRKADVRAANAGPVVPALAGTSLGPVSLPSDPAALVRLNGGIMAAAGSLLAINRLPRLSALVLAGSIVPTTISGHRFWEAEDEGEKRFEIGQALKNAGLLGGLLITAVDTDGKPSLGWRAKRARRDAARTAKAARASAKVSAKGAAKAARGAGKQTRRNAELAARRAKDAVGV